MCDRRDADSRMKHALTAVHEQMATLRADMTKEKSRLQGDNGRLQNLVSELRLKSQAEVASFRKEIERMEEGLEEDLRTAEEARATAVQECESSKQVSVTNGSVATAAQTA